MLKYHIDKLLSEGHGRQFLWLFVVTIFCIGTAIGISNFIFRDGILVWQDIVGLFLDPGVFGSFATKGHDYFRLILALLSVFLFSALLVSVFTNVFENIADSVRSGHRRYNVEDHILVLGSGHYLEGILKLSQKKKVIVMSENPVDLDGDYIYYNGHYYEENELISANVDQANTIYIIGDNNDENHDTHCMKALELLTRLCKNTQNDVHCYVIVQDLTSTEVMQYQKNVESSHLLLVDVLNENVIAAEQLLANDTFLPVIKPNEETKSEIFIFGTNPIAQAVAYTAAHISHYPNFATNGIKTRITFVGRNMCEWMDDLIATRRSLFELSSYEYISNDDKIIAHTPKGLYGDFLDIEWRFVEGHASSSKVESLLKETVDNPNSRLSIIVCNRDTQTAVRNVLHMPSAVYGRQNSIGAYRLAVFLQEKSSVITRANASGMYGHIVMFGSTNDDYLSLGKRSANGQEVNYIYNQKYSTNPAKDKEEAWYQISETDKYSSIFCANALPLRLKCFDGWIPTPKMEKLPYEVEHNRWVISELIMGFSSGRETNKKQFIHKDLIPFNKLPKEEQEKDKTIIENIDGIIKN